MTYEEILARMAELRSTIVELGDAESLDDEQRSSWDETTAEWDALNERKVDLEDRQKRAQAAASVPFNVITRDDPWEKLEDRNASESELKDAALHAVERRLGHEPTWAKNAANVIRTNDASLAREFLERSTVEYARAFSKMVTGRSYALTPEEQRAVNVGATTQGGFMVPTFLDPSIINTNEGTDNPFRRISRVVQLSNGNVWNGITSAGVTASWDAELVEVSDDAPTLANPQIPVYKGFAWVPASFEAFEDIAGLGTAVAAMLADSKDRLEGIAFATGNGSTAPTGIFTALDANTNVELTTTTAATIGTVDVYNVYRQLPARYRSRSSWVSHVVWLNAIRQLGTAVSASFSGTLADPLTERIIGRPVVESTDSPSTNTTTVADNLLVLGDFSNYVIVDRIGTSIEFVPQVFGATNSRPIGARGWLMHWRVGADSVNDNAFRLLQDKTSA